MNELFFGDHIADFKFKWTEEITPLLGIATTDGPLIEQKWFIEMHPQCMASDFAHYRVLMMLSTLLHEMIHVFLGRYGCYSCRRIKFNGQASNHGWPFQMIAAKLEEAVPRLLDIPFKSGRFDSLLAAWKTVYTLPSRHDGYVSFFKYQVDIEQARRREGASAADKGRT